MPEKRADCISRLFYKWIGSDTADTLQASLGEQGVSALLDTLYGAFSAGYRAADREWIEEIHRKVIDAYRKDRKEEA